MSIESKTIYDMPEKSVEEKNLIIDETQKDLKKLSADIMQKDPELIKKVIERKVEEQRNLAIKDIKQSLKGPIPDRYKKLLDEVLTQEKTTIIKTINDDVFKGIHYQAENCVDTKKYLAITSSLMSKAMNKLSFLEKGAVKLLPTQFDVIMTIHLNTFLYLHAIVRNAYENAAKIVYGSGTFQDFRTIAPFLSNQESVGKERQKEYEKFKKTV